MKLSDIAFERYEALFEQELYREKETPMWGSEHHKAARRKVYEAVIAECSKPAAFEKRYYRLRDAVDALYFSAYWHADRPVDETALWTEARDAAELPTGLTAVNLGPDRSKA